jgi:GMP synthase-like glutamine amidotransferase
MHAHYFQHVPFEGLGSIQDWLDAKGVRVSCTRFFESAELPALDGIDLLIVMGGPMSVNDEAQHPWLAAEKRFVRDAIAAGKAVLGVCLGAQMIASALGARVYPNAEREIGWFPVHAVPGSAEVAAGFRFPPSIEVLHWHGETFDLPPGAIHLARSQACEHQAFSIGRRVVGLQFHLEATPESVRAMIANDAADLAGPRRWVQGESALTAASPQRDHAIHAQMAAILDALVAAR